MKWGLIWGYFHLLSSMPCFYDLFLVVAFLCSWIVLYAWAVSEREGLGFSFGVLQRYTPSQLSSSSYLRQLMHLLFELGFRSYFIHFAYWTHKLKSTRGPELYPSREMWFSVAVASLTEKFLCAKKVTVLDVVDWWEKNGDAWELWPAWYRKVDNWTLVNMMAGWASCLRLGRRPV